MFPLPGTKYIIGSDIIGKRGNPIRVYSATLISGSTSGTLNLLNGTDSSGSVYEQLDGLANKSVDINYVNGKLFYNGCVAIMDSFSSSATINYIEEQYNTPLITSGILTRLYDIEGLIFYNDFTISKVNTDSDYSLGSPISKFTASRSVITPATYIDSNGKIQLVTTSNIPRYTKGFYDIFGFHYSPELLLEGASTNIFANGAFDTNSAWNGNNLQYSGTNRWALQLLNGATTTNSVSTDSNYIRSAKFTVTNAGASATDIDFYNADTVAITNGTKYTFSFYIKTSSAVTIPVVCINGIMTVNYGLNDSFTTVANTWIKVEKTFTANADASAYLVLFLGNLGLIDVYIEGLQFEALPHATSFIPTTVGSLTRNADNLSYFNTSNSANSETIILKLSTDWDAIKQNNNLYLYDTDTKSRRIILNATTGLIEAYANATDNVAVKAVSQSKLSPNVPHTIATVFQHVSPYISLYIDGVLEGTYTAGDFTAPTYGTNFYIGSDNAAEATAYGNSIYQYIIKYNRALSGSDITTIYNIIGQSNSQIFQISSIASPLTIPATSNQGQHPTVVYFPSVWNGYKYWMCFTPLTNSAANLENPTIISSNDGVNWVEPTGISNPIVAYGGSNNFNSDPDMIYNPDTNELWLYYRVYNDTGEHIVTDLWLTKSSDGINWSSPVKVIANADVEEDSAMLSPSVLRESATSWKMWWYNLNFPDATKISYWTSTDGVTWTFVGDNAMVAGSGIFHLDVIKIDSIYVMVYSTGSQIRYATSSDGITWTGKSLVLDSNGLYGTWNAQSTYRPTLVYINTDNILLYEGGYEDATTSRIGLFRTNSITLGL